MRIIMRYAIHCVVSGLIVAIFCMCGAKTDDKSLPKEVFAFRKFSEGFKMPMPGGISVLETLDIPGCMTGYRYSAAVPFKSRSMVSFYDTVFAALGLHKQPALTAEIGPWIERPITIGEGIKGRILNSEEDYFSKDGRVTCTVSLQYPLGSEGQAKTLKDTLQTVVASCTPNYRNPTTLCYPTDLGLSPQK